MLCMFTRRSLPSRQLTFTISTLRNQQQSPLPRLPAELRNKIYGYTLGHQLIHVDRNHREEERYRFMLESCDTAVNPTILLALTETSQQLRHEALPMFFSTNNFMINAVKLSGFLETIGKQKADLIEEVDIRDSWSEVKKYSGQLIIDYYAEDALKLLQGMKGLKRVMWEWISLDNMNEVNAEYAQTVKGDLGKDRVLQIDVLEW